MIAVTYEIAGKEQRTGPKTSDAGKNTVITRDRNNKSSRIKHRLQVIFNKESNTMQSTRIYLPDDARCHFFIF
jgi:hypothetical protein